jgi:transcriptional regulator with XRE-family HTH domain
VDKKEQLSVAGFNLAFMTTHDEICARIRALRISKGLSLREVEIQSAHRIRAVVLGSYERGDRSLSVKRAITIADFYDVPLSYLLEPPSSSYEQAPRAIIDLRHIRSMMADPAQLSLANSGVQTILKFIAAVVARRNDWNGEVLSIRADDLSTLAMSIGKSSSEIKEMLEENRLLLGSK